jgi:hypothetical protein
LVLKKFVRIENFVHAIGDPRVENAGASDAGHLENAGQRPGHAGNMSVLAGLIADVVLITQAEIFILRDEVFIFTKFFQF